MAERSSRLMKSQNVPYMLPSRKKPLYGRDGTSLLKEPFVDAQEAFPALLPVLLRPSRLASTRHPVAKPPFPSLGLYFCRSDVLLIETTGVLTVEYILPALNF